MSYTADLSKILYMMAEIYSTEVTEPLVDAWACVLQDEGITIEQAKTAAIMVMKSRVYTKMPTPADFLEVLKPNVKTIADGQADIVLQAVRDYRSDRPPKFEDPITAKLMSTRWPFSDFAQTLEKDAVKWWRKQFAADYQDLKEAEEREQRLLEARETKQLTDGQ